MLFKGPLKFYFFQLTNIYFRHSVLIILSPLFCSPSACSIFSLTNCSLNIHCMCTVYLLIASDAWSSMSLAKASGCLDIWPNIPGVSMRVFLVLGFFFQSIFYWLCYYSCPIFFFLLFPSTPPPTSIPHPLSSCPRVVHVSCLASPFSILFLTFPCLFCTYHLYFLFPVPFLHPPLSLCADNPPWELHFRDSVPVLDVCLVSFCFLGSVVDSCELVVTLLFIVLIIFFFLLDKSL